MKKKDNLPWRQQPSVFPYDEDILNNEQYLKDRTELFRKNGNGWWWIPTTPKQKRKNR
tara:strand:+ start:332 stop:505 length:174 start_codon:yes stop_codon:yes gene_type:complete